MRTIVVLLTLANFELATTAAVQSTRSPSFDYTVFAGCDLITVVAENDRVTERLAVRVPRESLPDTTARIEIDLARPADGVRVWVDMFERPGPHNGPVSDRLARGDEQPVTWLATAGALAIVSEFLRPSLYRVNIELRGSIFRSPFGAEAQPRTPIRFNAEVGKCGG